METSDSDLTFGMQVVRELVDFKTMPPLVKRDYQSLGRLHAELRFLGMRLVRRDQIGPEAGFMLFYTKGNVLVRIKTRGSGGKFRGGVPHLTVSLTSGKPLKSGEVDLSKDAEVGMFFVGGGLVNKSARGKSSLYDPKRNIDAKRNQEDWSDGTHFDFPDLDLDDQGAEDLPLS